MQTHFTSETAATELLKLKENEIILTVKFGLHAKEDWGHVAIVHQADRQNSFGCKILLSIFKYSIYMRKGSVNTRPSPSKPCACIPSDMHHV